jgi:phage terminase large subunit-like protein
VKTALQGLPAPKQIAYNARLAWLKKARPKQIPPRHLDWFAFLALAGRGFGKSRICSEDSWWYACWNDGVRIVVVAPTNSDLRKTVFEGESGLLAVTPPELVRDYNKSTSELTFYNGSIIQGFSSESYQRLRGPQFHRGWGEELCLTAGTLISTEHGLEPIENIRSGMRVQTRSGLKKVVRSWKTSDSALVYRLRTSDGRELIGTGNHPVFVDREGFLPLKSLMDGNILEANAKACSVLDVEILPDRQPVFNFEVEDNHEYFANGILTHNCAWPYLQETWDQLMMTLRLTPPNGGRPQLILSTTPRPFKLIKELTRRSDVYKVTGSTYENKDNLAASFLDVVEKQYAGTRIGKQELEGFVLEDTPGALWNWKMIERCRYMGICPDFRYISVNIDPSVGDGNPDNDECGIVATALGEDEFGYVLGDRSMQGSPNEWVGAAIELYRELGAHWIVAEANNGGKLIEDAIHAVDSNIPVRLVHAAQGKRTRAEPVAMLYEQGRIRHFGVYSDLETQLTDWSPEFSKFSPGRMDALVWGFTALMVERPSDFFCFVA